MSRVSELRESPAIRDSIPEPKAARAVVSRQLLTIPETARRLGVEVSTVRRWRFKGVKLQFVKLGDSQTSAIRVTVESVERLIGEGLQPILDQHRGDDDKG